MIAHRSDNASTSTAIDDDHVWSLIAFWSTNEYPGIESFINRAEDGFDVFFAKYEHRYQLLSGCTFMVAG